MISDFSKTVNAALIGCTDWLERPARILNKIKAFCGMKINQNTSLQETAFLSYSNHRRASNPTNKKKEKNMSTLSFEMTMGKITEKYGHETPVCEIPNHEFETGGLFGQLAKDAGIESPGAYALVNDWNAWSKSVDALIEMFRMSLEAENE